MADDTAALLQNVPLFEGLSPAEIKVIRDAAREVDHADGHTIVGEGQSGVGFHLILSGEASVTRDGQEIDRLRPGQFFGEMALIDGQARSATVTADGPVRTLSIVAWRFEPLLEQHPKMAIAIMKQLCARLRRNEAAAVS